MSLIDDALRRVQDPTASQVQAPPRPTGEQAPTQTTPAHPWPVEPSAKRRAPPVQTNVLLIVGLAVFILTVGLLVGGAFWIGRTVSGTPPAAPREVTPLQPQIPLLADHRVPDASSPRSTLSGRQPAQPGYVLTGIVEGLGEPLAVINGAITTVGDRVGGATVREVTPRVVKLLRDDGTELILQVSR